MSVPIKQAGQQAEEVVAQLFKDNGWRVERGLAFGRYKADLIIKRPDREFVVEVKSLSEGRADRVLPLLSQAILQAQAVARAHGNAQPLAIVYLGASSLSLVRHVRDFAMNFASGVALGIVSEDGSRFFVGDGLEDLNAEPRVIRGSHEKASSLASHLFSDLNQWMLKVLLASEVPEKWLAAPRGAYSSVSEFALAAHVSQMSASRFIRQLKAEGYLDESARHFKLVRRADLFQRWQASGLRASPVEIPMVFMLGGPIESHLRQLESNNACLGLFAAADAHKLGHVSGVPPHVYGPRWDRLDPNVWSILPAPARPDFILREARAPQSIFRGMVRVDGVPVCDAIQVWLDVSRHPSRGAEQAELIYHRVLGPIVEGAARE
jgi:hypothetical protein